MFTRIVEVTDSGTISKIAYDLDNRIVRITFATGSKWDYLNVYPTDFAKLAAAYSPGEIYNARYRDRFECVKVEEEVKEVRLKAKPIKKTGFIKYV